MTVYRVTVSDTARLLKEIRGCDLPTRRRRETNATLIDFECLRMAIRSARRGDYADMHLCSHP